MVARHGNTARDLGISAAVSALAYAYPEIPMMVTGHAADRPDHRRELRVAVATITRCDDPFGLPDR